MKQLSERSLLLLLAAVQFTHIMDFMILMPLGPQLMRELHIGPGHFSALVAAYTISSGVVGLLAAPFIDRFDRRKVLLLAYAGFTAGTLACALAQNATTLLAARALSGAFGGLSISMVMSIIGDVVPAERRAAGVGIVSYLEVVDANREALQAERGRAQLTGQRLAASVQLIRALGGGWNEQELFAKATPINAQPSTIDQK